METWTVKNSRDFIYLVKNFKTIRAWYGGRNYPQIREDVLTSELAKVLAE